MSDLNEKLNKSLEEIDRLADEVLSKSEEPEKVEDGVVETPEAVVETPEGVTQVEGEDVEKGLKPDDVSDQSEDNGADEAGDKEGNDEEEDSKDDKEDVKKSFYEEAKENPEIQKGLDVSDFLNEFTRLHGQIVDSLRDDVSKSLNSSSQTATILAKSFNAIMKSQNELSKSIENLAARLDTVERQPVGRKAMVNVVEKSFNHSAGIQEPIQELSKAEKLSKLTAMAMQGNQGVAINDVIHYESTGQLRPELEKLLQQK